jgi:hypothetical protein
MLGSVMVGVQVPFTVCLGVAFLRRWEGNEYSAWVWGIFAWLSAVVSDVLVIIAGVTSGNVAEVTLGVVFLLAAAGNLWWLWRNRGNRKKTRELPGAKSRVLRDKIVRKLREVTTPSPVPVPV